MVKARKSGFMTWNIRIKLSIVILCLLGAVSCSRNKSMETILKLNELHNGDAKFYGDKVITNVDNYLCLIDFNGQIKRYDEVKCNWIDAIAEEGVIVYGNFDNEIGIVQLDDSLGIISNQILWKSEHLSIDPAIIKIGRTYFMTATEINGTVNNADINAENGIYTIKLYKSMNLEDWVFVSDIISHRNNLEDIKLVDNEGRLCVIYEKEIVDKGKSSICMLQSMNEACTIWQEERILMEAEADQEPAGMFKNDDSFLLFYSSDKNAPGESYMGSGLYYSEYDSEFNLIKKDIKIDSQIGDGQLLYDVKYDKEYVYYMTAVNYLTDCDLAIQRNRTSIIFK